MILMRRALPAILLLLAASATLQGQVWSLFYDHSIPQVRFAASEIRGARGGRLVEQPLDRLGAPAPGPVRIVIAAGGDDAGRVARSLGLSLATQRTGQSYSIRRRVHQGGTTIAVLGADARGAMYGGLDVAEAIRLGTIEKLADSDHSPHIEQRGIKFNIPLDVRTPSYSDNSHSAQNNIPEMWSFDFWREFLDEMARHRFNVLSLWNLHPFPSLVKVPEFPEVALNDVSRTRVPMRVLDSGNGSEMVNPEMLQNTETVKKMTIGQKIQFWRDVMQYAQDRGIEVYWFTWNLFTWGAQGKHGITPDQTNPRTLEYFRASVRETVLTYPLLAGFGITAGERMQNRTDEFAKEKWLWRAYGLGVTDAVKLQPERKVRMIHRYHQTGHEEILREWRDYPGPFDLSYKYSVAHMYSIPNPPFINEVLPHLNPKLRTWLTVRDDDYYSFRWGDPSYARDYIRHMPGKDKVAGFYMGPDGYIWGREFLSTEPETPRQLVISKRWYAFMIWGRLTYEPTLPDEVFRQTLATRFPEISSEALFRAWSAASKIFPEITRFFWGDIDVRWFPEACLSHPRVKGFYTVEHFMNGQTMPGSGLTNIREWSRRIAGGQPAGGPGPLETANALAAHAEESLKLVAELRPAQGSNKELRLTLGDLTAMAHLGHYYAEKVRGASDLALFDRTGLAERRESAIGHLELALEHWKRYASAYTLQYEQPRLYNRVGWVDIPGLTANVEKDIATARQWRVHTLKD